MKTLRKIVDYYRTLVLSVHFLCAGGMAKGRAYMDINRTVSVLVLTHTMNVAALAFLVVPSRQLDELAFAFEGKQRLSILAFMFLTGMPFVAWIVFGLRKKLKEVAENRELFLQALRRGRGPAILYLVLSAVAVLSAFAVAASRKG